MVLTGDGAVEETRQRQRMPWVPNTYQTVIERHGLCSYLLRAGGTRWSAEGSCFGVGVAGVRWYLRLAVVRRARTVVARKTKSCVAVVF